MRNADNSFGPPVSGLRERAWLGYEGAQPKGNPMYIGIGTILLILLIVLLVRAFAGRSTI